MKQEQLDYETARLQGNNEIGGIEQTQTQETERNIKSLKKEKQLKDDAIAKNMEHQQLLNLKEEQKDLKTKRDALDAIINSPEFKDPIEAMKETARGDVCVKELLKIDRERMLKRDPDMSALSRGTQGTKGL